MDQPRPPRDIPPHEPGEPPPPDDPHRPQAGSAAGSVTRWIGDLKAGDTRALAALWDRYFTMLVRKIRARLCASRAPTAVSDEEDLALSVINALNSGIRNGRFPDLDDRDDLWRVLAHLVKCKLIDRQRREHTGKNPDLKTIREADMIVRACEVNGAKLPMLDGLLAAGPTPEMTAELAEELRLRRDALGRSDYRRIAELKLMGYTNSEIALELGCMVRSVQLKLELMRKRWKKTDTQAEAVAAEE
ncbi:MAG: ECF-type sigma factor [Isosphaeraceae bacterium]